MMGCDERNNTAAAGKQARQAADFFPQRGGTMLVCLGDALAGGGPKREVAVAFRKRMQEGGAPCPEGSMPQ